MSNFFALDPIETALFTKLVFAMVCGILLGTERVISHKAAGMRTYALVSMGAALFIIAGDIAIKKYIGMGLTAINPLYIAAAIVTGIGFMGAGVIIFRDKSVTGLTTASSLWIAAGIGLACGYGFFRLAGIVTLLTLFILLVLWRFEQMVKKYSYLGDESDNNGDK